MSPSEAAKLLSSITQQNKRDLYKWLTKKVEEKFFLNKM